MKQLVMLLCSLLFLSNCQQKSEEKTANTDTTAVGQMVGNDLDEHGCKGSAGYVWSVVKNDCVRIFEVGVRLDPQDSTLNQTLSAFAVFANDEKENEFDVEIFLPSLADGSIVLKPIKDDGAGTWDNGSYTLTQWKGMYTLEEGKKTIYQGHR
jgi:hypothetical protein